MQGNEQQKKAIAWDKGPALILAGPGSGKTFTTVERVRYLTEVRHVEPSEILVITFTKAAARQMRERFLHRMGNPFSPVNFGTFHAVFFHILQTSCHYSRNSILNEKQKREYLKMALSTTGGELPEGDGWEEGLLKEIGFIKNAGQLPPDFQSGCLTIHQFQETYVRFQRIIREMGRLDLDDFAAFCLHLFRTKPETLREWQRKYVYILVDEFQDINASQYAVIKLLAGKTANLFAVGDDDQSIYGFRGADPSVMKQFVQDFPQAAQITLSVNYRSRRGIADTAAKLINCNRDRFPKKIVCGKTENSPADTKALSGIFQTGRPGVWIPVTQDGSVTAGGFQTRREQMRVLAEEIERLRRLSKGKSVAAVFRTNSYAALLAEELGRAGILFLIRERMQNPYESPVCLDILAYLKFAMQEQDRSSFLRIMNRPCRYLSRQMLTEKQISFPKLLKACQDREWMKDRIIRMQSDISHISGMDLYAAVNYIRKGIGYDEYLLNEMSSEQLKEALDTAAFFQDSVKNMKSLKELLSHIDSYGKQLREAGKDRPMAAENDTENVILMTMHSAKGLEFDVVFLPDCNEGVVPHKKSRNKKELEEERRLFYVGMTRAREQLILSWVKGTKENPGFPSRFLGDCGIREAYVY